MKLIKQYMEEHCEDMIEALRGFVNIPSVSSDIGKVDEALDYVLNLATEMGFEAKSVLDHRIGIVEFGEGDETIGILSHVDVVPPGDLSGWNTPPFEMTEKDGKLFGRGTIDDKGAIIASLYAMKYIRDTGKPVHKKIRMILGTQEEVEWTDMEDYVKSYPLPDYGFTPDGEFPVCNIEKGSMDIVMSFPCEQNFEEDGWYLTSLNAGQATNAVPGKCTAKVSRVENGEVKEEKTLEAFGKSVHSCQPEKGENAVFSMAEQVKELKIKLKPNRMLSVLYMLNEKFSSIYGKELGLYSETEYYNGEYVHRNVFSPTLIKTEESDFNINVNVRFAFGADTDEISSTLTGVAEEFGGSLNVASVLPAVYVSKDRPFMDAFAKAYEKECGKKNEFVLAYGGSYAKAMPNVVSWGPIFPGDEDTCHEDNEYISIDCLLANGRIFASALAKIALAEEHYK